MNNKIQDILKEKNNGIKLDIAGGGNPQPGFVNIDIRKSPKVDIVHDLETFPWPLPNECCSLAVASHIVEHIDPHKFIFIKFMNEIWRIMKDGGQLMIATPYAGSVGYFQDPTHCNPCNEATWFYFDPLHYSGLYHIYNVLPWKILSITWTPIGNLEIALEKRKIDKSYNVNEMWLNKNVKKKK